MKVSHMPELNCLLKKNYGREQLLLFNIANKTVEACAKLVSAFFHSHVVL